MISHLFKHLINIYLSLPIRWVWSWVLEWPIKEIWHFSFRICIVAWMIDMNWAILGNRPRVRDFNKYWMTLVCVLVGSMCKGMPAYSQEGSVFFPSFLLTFVSLTILYCVVNSDTLKSGRALLLLFVIVTSLLWKPKKSLFSISSWLLIDWC